MRKESLVELKKALLEFSEKTRWWRRKTPFEERVKLSEIKKRINKAEESYVQAISEILLKSLDRVVKSIEQVLKKEDLLGLRDIRIGYHDKMVNVVRENLMDLFLFGKQSVYEELKKEGTIVKHTRQNMRAYRIKAEAIVAELEGRLKARALLIVLNGVKKNRPVKEIVSQVRGLSERRRLSRQYYDPSWFEEHEHPRHAKGSGKGGQFAKKGDQSFKYEPVLYQTVTGFKKNIPAENLAYDEFYGTLYDPDSGEAVVPMKTVVPEKIKQKVRRKIEERKTKTEIKIPELQSMMDKGEYARYVHSILQGIPAEHLKGITKIDLSHQPTDRRFAYYKKNLKGSDGKEEGAEISMPKPGTSPSFWPMALRHEVGHNVGYMMDAGELSGLESTEKRFKWLDHCLNKYGDDALKEMWEEDKVDPVSEKFAESYACYLMIKDGWNPEDLAMGGYKAESYNVDLEDVNRVGELIFGEPLTDEEIIEFKYQESEDYQWKKSFDDDIAGAYRKRGDIDPYGMEGYEDLGNREAIEILDSLLNVPEDLTWLKVNYVRYSFRRYFPDVDWNAEEKMIIKSAKILDKKSEIFTDEEKRQRAELWDMYFSKPYEEIDEIPWHFSTTGYNNVENIYDSRRRYLDNSTKEDTYDGEHSRRQLKEENTHDGIDSRRRLKDGKRINNPYRFSGSSINGVNSNIRATDTPESRSINKSNELLGKSIRVTNPRSIGEGDDFVRHESRLLIEERRVFSLQEIFDGRVGNLVDEIKRFLLGSASVHIVEAINDGRANAYEEIKNEIAYYQWSAILDEKVCTICHELDSQYFSSADPLLDMIYPPIHSNCRCILIGVLKEEARRYPIRINRLSYSDAKRYTRNKFWLPMF